MLCSIRRKLISVKVEEVVPKSGNWWRFFVKNHNELIVNINIRKNNLSRCR